MADNEEPQIGLRLPTLINYASLMARMLLSIVFSVVVARELPPSEYGLWGIVLSLSTTLLVPLWLLTWWAPRQEAWGRRGAGTAGLIITLAYGAVAGAIFAASSRAWGAGAWVTAGALMVPAMMAFYYLGSLASIVDPKVSGISLLLFDVSRVGFVYLLVIMWGRGLIGAITSFTLAYLISGAYAAWVAWRRRVLWGPPDLHGALRWLKLSHTLLPAQLGGILRGFYRSYVSLVTGSLEAVARLNVGLAAETPLTRISSMTSSALYARLLRRVSAWDVEESIRLYLAFSGFVTASLMALAEPVAAVYNPIYIDAAGVVRVIGFHAFLLGLTWVYSTVLRGLDRFDFDIDNPPGLVEALKRPWARPGWAQLGGLALSYAVYPLLLLIEDSHPAREALLAALALFGGTLAYTLYLGVLAHRLTSSRFPWRIAGEVLASATVTVFLYRALEIPGGSLEEYGFWELATALAIRLTLGAIIYTAALLALSPWARGLAAAALERLRGRR